MKITLACPSEWFERPDLGGAGETVDVDDQLGAQLVREGYAQVATASLTVAEVEAAAVAENVDLSNAKTAKEKRDALAAARNEKKEG